MSQDTQHVFSARRPRETLGHISHNATSAIPLPSSALKRSNSISHFDNPTYTSNHARSTSGSRMSLAPGRPSQPMFQRSSSGSNLADMGFSTVQRHSSSNTYGSTGGRKSYAPVSSTPASALQLQQSTQRRSSVYSVRQSSSVGQAPHQSFFAFAPQPAGVPRDPRPLKDRTFQNQMGQELTEYLTAYNYGAEMNTSLRHNTMSLPTQKDFELIFQWLYHRIDPSYMFRLKIDAEVPQILKQLRYPYERSITKSALSAVGGTSWSTFLGMLHWLMQLAKMTEQFAAGEHDDATLEAGIDVTGDRICFDFLADAYRTWLGLGDEQDDEADALIKPHVDAMAARFNHANAKYLEQMKLLEKEQRQLQDRIDELSKTGPKIAKMEEQIKILEEDRSKFEAYISSMQAKVGRSEERAKLLRQEIERVDDNLGELEAERDALQALVDKSGISMQDIDRLNNERERLQKGLEVATARLEEVKEEVTKKEVTASQALDALEGIVQQYNSVAEKAQMIPATARNANGQEYRLVINVNEGPDFKSPRPTSSESPEPDRLLADTNTGYQASQLLNLDLKMTMKAVAALRKQMNESRRAAAEVDIEKREILEGSREALDEKHQEIATLTHRIRAAEEELEKTREITNAEKMTSDAQIEKLEKELAHMRTSLTESVQHMEQKEMNTTFQYDQLKVRADALREELHTEVERMLTDVVNFKVHIQKSLEGYEQLVAEELEAEWEEVDGNENNEEQTMEI